MACHQVTELSPYPCRIACAPSAWSGTETAGEREVCVVYGSKPRRLDRELPLLDLVRKPPNQRNLVFSEALIERCHQILVREVGDPAAENSVLLHAGYVARTDQANHPARAVLASYPARFVSLVGQRNPLPHTTWAARRRPTARPSSCNSRIMCGLP